VGNGGLTAGTVLAASVAGFDKVSAFFKSRPPNRLDQHSAKILLADRFRHDAHDVRPVGGSCSHLFSKRSQQDNRQPARGSLGIQSQGKGHLLLTRVACLGNQHCVYDAGVFEWAKVHPDQALFFDIPLNAEKVNSALIPQSVFEAVCLETEAFKAHAADPAFKVYDIRERSDRVAKPMAFNNDIRLVLDDFVTALDKEEIPKEKILVYDNVGKQVMWLQYYLQKHGIKDYYFLKGGVRAIK